MITFDVMYYGQRQGEPRKFSHSYKETWEKTPLYCPHCGKRNVWHETSGGDYYVGETFLCGDCTAHFYLPTWPEPRPTDEQDKQRLVAIRSSPQTETR